MLQKLRKHPVFETLPDCEKGMCLTYIDKKLESRNLIRILHVKNAIFSSENFEDKKKRISLLLNEYANKGLIADDAMKKLSQLLKSKMSKSINEFNDWGTIEFVCWKETYKEAMMSLSSELQSPTCISGFERCSHQGLNILSYWINEVVKSIIPFMANKDSLDDEKNAWYGISYVEDVDVSARRLLQSMSSKKYHGYCAIDSFCKSDDLDKLYETISRAMIPKPLALQIRKKINKRMQSKTDHSEIDSEDDKTNLSNLVELFHTNCQTIGKPFAEELSSCFDLANKEVVLNRFRKKLGL